MSLVAVETSPTPEPTTSPFASATATIQAAAKWIVAALAAVGGVLVSSVPLTGLGKFNSVHEFVYAGIGLLLALAAVGFTIGTAARVLTTEHITLSALAADRLPTKVGGGPEPIEETIRQITRSREELFGDVANDLGDLSARLASTNKSLRNASTNVLSQPSHLPKTVLPVPGIPLGTAAKAAPSDEEIESEEIEATSLSSFAARLQDAARTVVEFANYDVARRNFSTLTVRLLAAGFIAVVGVVDYAYWVSRPRSPRSRLRSRHLFSSHCHRGGPGILLASTATPRGLLQ